MTDVHYVGNHTVGNFQSLNVNPNLLTAAKYFPNFLSPDNFCQDTTEIGYGTSKLLGNQHPFAQQHRLLALRRTPDQGAVAGLAWSDGAGELHL